MLDTLDYSLRESDRARYVTLKINRTQGLVVVVPRHFDRDLVPTILESRRHWIEKQLIRFEALPGRFDCDWPPPRLDLTGAGLIIDIAYQQISGNHILLNQNDNLLQVGLPESFDNENLAALLVGWIRELAKAHCEAMASELSEATKLTYKKLTVRAQKTRWGSFSSHGTLSLNYKLVFLPEHLVRHVILHELCHSVHMNHSPEFWALLQTVDEEALENDSELNHAWKYLPFWLN